MVHYKPGSRPGLDFIIAEVNEQLKDDVSKTRKLPPQFNNSYILFDFSDRPSLMNYTSEVMMTALDKTTN